MNLYSNLSYLMFMKFHQNFHVEKMNFLISIAHKEFSTEQNMSNDTLKIPFEYNNL